MQCGCPECGILMTQVEKGLKSACKCPECGFECSACLGMQKGVDTLFQKGMSKEEWDVLLSRRYKDGED